MLYEYTLFSVGEYENDIAYFARERNKRRFKQQKSSDSKANKSYVKNQEKIYQSSKAYKEKNPPSTGMRKGHQRVVDGKVSWVKESFQKAGEATKGALDASKQFIGDKSTQAGNWAKANPGTVRNVGIGAGGLAAAGAAYGGYRFLTRKKRRRG